MEVYTQQQHQSRLRIDGLRVIPTALVLMAYLGDKDAKRKIKEIEAHNAGCGKRG